MLFATSTPEARANARKVHVNGHDYVLNGYIGHSPTRGRYVEGNEKNDNGLPQGFLVEQPPGAVTQPHFHEVNQFQVVVGGGGMFGKHKVKPIALHYAGGHTPYGPIASGDGGITYFTLRCAWDPGAKYMPKSRHLRKPVKPRFRYRDGIGLSDPTTLKTQTDVACEVVVEPEEDGLAAWSWRLGPNADLAAADPASGGGQYHVVIAGSVVHEGKDLPLWSCIMVTPEETAPGIRAGADGLELLLLQFPRA